MELNQIDVHPVMDQNKQLMRELLHNICSRIIIEERLIHCLHVHGLRAEHISLLRTDKRQYRILATRWLFEDNQILYNLCLMKDKNKFLSLYFNG